MDPTWRTPTHKPLHLLGEGIWQVEADLSSLPIGRRMVIIRTRGGVLVHNPICADEATMVEIAAIGPVRWLIVPSSYHGMDLAAWNARFPDCKVIAMPAAADRLRKKGRVDGGPELMPADPAVSYTQLDGVPLEGVLAHRVGDRATLVFNDVVQNHQRLPGMIGAVLGLIGSTGGPKVTGIARLAMVKDKRAFATHLRRLATPEVALVVPGHGALIQERSHEVLREIADRL